MLRLVVLLVAFASLATALSGCLGATPESTPEPLDDSEIGGIDGLLVDDLFRPVHLKTEWAKDNLSAFEDMGFILIVETGARLETTQNGEFSALLSPGTYTLRVAADHHEARDHRVDVVAGEFTQTTLESRRLTNQNPLVLSHEEVLFIACSATTLVFKWQMGAVGNNGCGDFSGDSSRFNFSKDFSAYADAATALVTEMRASQDGYYLVSLHGYPLTRTELLDEVLEGETSPYHCERCQLDRWFQYGDSNDRGHYGRGVLFIGDSLIREHAEEPRHYEISYLSEGQDGWCHPRHTDKDSCSGFWAPDLSMGVMTSLWPDHPSKQYQDQITDPHEETICQYRPEEMYGIYTLTREQCDFWGTGVTLGTKGKFLQTLFIHEFERNLITEFCALCDEYEIPE